jgi:hypothetical protein
MIRPLCVVVVLLALTPRPAAAQEEPGIEIGGGAAVLRDTKNTVNLRGWYLEAAAKVRPGVSVVVEGSSTWRTQPLYAGDFEVARLTLRVNSVMAGARLSTHVWKAREVAQILAGRLSATGSNASAPDPTPHWVIQPGIGLEFPLMSRLALRIQLDGRFIGADGRGNENGVQFRLASGVVYALRR